MITLKSLRLILFINLFRSFQGQSFRRLTRTQRINKHLLENERKTAYDVIPERYLFLNGVDEYSEMDILRFTGNLGPGRRRFHSFSFFIFHRFVVFSLPMRTFL